ncbi:MAG: alpha/beta family hydrolase [Rhodococcus sp. (in: high G+C Gram-positive bacteria)]
MRDSTSEVRSIGSADVRGVLHVPDGEPTASLALTHGAGGNADAALLVDMAETWAARGITVLRFDLAFRRARPTGPPHLSKAAGDRDSIRAALDFLRASTAGPLFVGGHSYGGRQASMLAAEDSNVAIGLVLLSYPLHPPKKPEKARTAHLSDIMMPSLFVSGDKDPFGSPTELRSAIDMVPAATQFVEVAGAAHDLSAAKHRVAARTLDAASILFGFEPVPRADD